MSYGKAAAAHDEDSVIDPAAVAELRRPKYSGVSWHRKAEVLAAVKETGKLRWAHEILALDAAGLYPSPAGVDIAREALGVKA